MSDQATPFTIGSWPSDQPETQLGPELFNQSALPSNHPSSAVLSLLDYDHKWEIISDIPTSIPDCNQSCIVIDKVIYVAQKQRVYRYTSGKEWTLLPSESFDVKNFSLGRLKKELVTVGGYDLKIGEPTGVVLKFANSHWMDKVVPSLCKPRGNPGVACSDNYIIASGGWIIGDGGKKNLCNDVEILDVSRQSHLQWQTVRSLPFDCSSPSSVIVNNEFVILTNPFADDDAVSTCVFAEMSCLVQAESKEKEQCLFVGSDAMKIRQYDHPSNEAPWIPIESAPPSANIVLLGKSILAFSGFKVYAFSFMTKKWCYVSNLPDEGMALCATPAVFGDEKIMFIGGKDKCNHVKGFRLTNNAQPTQN